MGAITANTNRRGVATTSSVALSPGILASFQGATAAALPKARTETVLFSSTGGAGGEYLYGAIWNNSQLYGITYDGGSINGGTLYTLSTACQMTILNNFQGAPKDGSAS